MVKVNGLTLILGALLALPATLPARADPTSTAPASAAYPRAPGGMPAASDDGKPVEPKAACAGAACPDKPGPSDAATSETTALGGVRTPTTAYPGSPVKTPAASDRDGKAPK